MKRLIIIPLGILSIILAIFLRFDSDPHSLEEISESENDCWKLLAPYATLAAKDTDVNPILNRKLHARINRFQSLVEHSLVYREKMIWAYEQFKARDSDSPVSGKWLDILKTGSKGYTDLRENIYVEAERFECLVNSEDSLLEEANVDPKLRLKAVMLSLAASLTLYDNYMLAVAVLQEDEEMRRILNEADRGFNLGENELLNLTRSASDPYQRARIRAAQEYYESQLAHLGKEAFAGDDDFHYLNLLIKQSASYNYVKNIQAWTIFRENFKWLGQLGKGFLGDIGVGSVNFVSMLFGNGVGSIQFGLGHLGKLYDNETVRKELEAKLRAGDLLVEKTPFRLTDRFIPGHWGHVAIWIGTKSELQYYDLWDDPIWHDTDNYPELRAYRKEIEAAAMRRVGDSDERDAISKNGPLVAEALRSGVQLNSLRHFMNVDDIAVLRSRNELSFDEMRATLYRTLQQIGKEYDFNFDVETLDKIVCSELAYQTYHSIDWETQETAGRFTISPDHVAKQAFGGELELITFYHDGKLVRDGEQLALMAQLMALETK